MNHASTFQLISQFISFKNIRLVPFVESLALPLVVHQKVVQGGGRLDTGAASVIANAADVATVATAWACGGEAEGGLGQNSIDI